MDPRHGLKGADDVNPNQMIAWIRLDDVILATGYKTTEKWKTEEFLSKKSGKNVNYGVRTEAEGILGEQERNLEGLNAENWRRE